MEINTLAGIEFLGLEVVCPCCGARVNLEKECINCKGDLIMGFIEKLKNVREVCKQIMEEHPDTRDNYRLLMLKVWAKQDPRLRTKEFSFLDFSKDFLAGRYADIETIRRNWQLLQAHNEHLQGATYASRQKEGDKTTKEINND